MGIAAGIVVVRQITDEHKWFQAMNHIQNEFEREDYFVTLPDFKKYLFSDIIVLSFVVGTDF